MPHGHVHWLKKFTGGTPIPQPPLPSGMLLWLKSDVGVNVVGGGDEHVTQWNDQSGNGNHQSQAVAGSRPLRVAGVLAGKPAIRGDGVDDVLTGSLGVGTYAEATILAVSSMTGVSGNWAIFDSSDNLLTNRGLMLFQEGGQKRCRVLSPVLQATYAFAATTPTIHVGVKDETTDLANTTVQIYEANVLKQSVTGVGHAGNLPKTNSSIFAFVQAALFALSGDIFELMLYPVLLTPTQRAQAVTYLQARWGL